MRVRATLHLRNDKMLEARESLGLTQAQVADVAGTRTEVVGCLERMDYTCLMPESLQQVSSRVAMCLELDDEDVLPPDAIGVAIPHSHRVVFDADASRMLDMQSHARNMLPAPDDALLQSERNCVVAKSLDTLPARLREMVSMRYGLDGDGEATLEECAKAFRITKERARQLIERALRRLQSADGIGEVTE